MSGTQKQVLNFNAGPAKVPHEVLLKAQQELVYYKDTGISVMEMSHRSPDFEAIIGNAEKLLREIMKIPDNYKVLFMHGSGTGQFASIPLNIAGSELQGASVDYVITGSWSDKAAKEAAKYLKVNRVNPAVDKYTHVPAEDTWKTDPNAKYLYYTDNETIHGIEFNYEVASKNGKIPVVVDMTSNFLTRPVNVSNFGAIIAGTQKNAGISGLAIVIVREDLIGNPMSICPSVLDFNIMNKNKSLYNTPPTYSIYMCSLFLQWIKDQGGLEEMGRRADQRSKLVYDVIDKSAGFYHCAVSPDSRSRVTPCFRVGSAQGDEALEKKFVDQAKKANMVGVKGHRLVGGIRPSMFNAQTIDAAKTVSEFMIKFMNENRK